MAHIFGCVIGLTVCIHINAWKTLLRDSDSSLVHAKQYKVSLTCVVADIDSVRLRNNAVNERCVDAVTNAVPDCSARKRTDPSNIIAPKIRTR